MVNKNEAMASLSPEDLNNMREYPYHGNISGWGILITVARHAAEHMGQAMLTRDLVKKREQ